MSRTTPTRKSRRMNTQPSSAPHRYTAFQLATPIADPQKAPSSARPPSAEILEPIRCHERRSSAELAFKEAAAIAFGFRALRRSATRAAGERRPAASLRAARLRIPSVHLTPAL